MSERYDILLASIPLFVLLGIVGEQTGFGIAALFGGVIISLLILAYLLFVEPPTIEDYPPKE